MSILQNQGIIVSYCELQEPIGATTPKTMSCKVHIFGGGICPRHCLSKISTGLMSNI